MLIDLLDKKIRLENSYTALKNKIDIISCGAGSVDNFLSSSLDILNKIRSFDLLIKEEKDKIKVTIGEQTFSLNEWEIITNNIKSKIVLYDIILSNSGSGVDTLSAIEQRDTLQAELDQINKAMDIYIWRTEINDG